MPRLSERPLGIRETDLAGPVHDFLVENGYTVRSEVGDCDIAALKDGELIVIELKRSLSIGLLIQATQRQRVADSVYVAIPMPARGTSNRAWRQACHLVKRLELGLIVVTLAGVAPRMEILFHPLPLERKRDNGRRRAILKEIAGRTGDFNRGGSTGQPLVTAYREMCIFVAVCLDRLGPSSPKAVEALGTGPKTLAILRHNHYGWFERIDRGVYAITREGRSGLRRYARIAAACSGKLSSEPPDRTAASAAEADKE